MKQYVLLSFEAEGYNSGAEHNEEFVLPVEAWEEIKDDVRMFVWCHGLDGKHSEVQAKIDVDYVSEAYLKGRYGLNQDGDKLLDHVYEYLDDEKYSYEYLKNLQDEVLGKNEYGTAIIKFPLENKDILFENLKMYDVTIISED